MRWLQPANLARVARILFYLDAVIWVGLAVTSLARLSGWPEPRAVVMLVVAGLMLGNAVILAWLGWLGRPGAAPRASMGAFVCVPEPDPVDHR
jgi:hypothetical protein